MSLSGWPYARQAQKFAPQLTVNRITPENKDDRTAEISAQLLEQRTYNNAISDLRLGEQEAAAMQRRDFAPVAKAVEQLGSITGLAAVAPEALAESYKKAIEKAATTGDYRKVVQDVSEDINKKIENGELDAASISTVREKIEEIDIPVSGVIKDASGRYEWDNTAGKLIDTSDGKEVATVEPERSSIILTFGDGSTQRLSATEWRAMFNDTGKFLPVKEKKQLARINGMFAKLDPTRPPAYAVASPPSPEEKEFQKLTPAIRGNLLRTDLEERLALKPGTIIEAVDKSAALQIADKNRAVLSLIDDKKNPINFEVRFTPTTATIERDDGKKWDMTSAAFMIWMDAAGVIPNRYLKQYVVRSRRGKETNKPMSKDLRALFIRSELDKQVGTAGKRMDYLAAISDLYASSGASKNPSLAKLVTEAKAAPRPLTGEGMKGGKTFRAKTTEVGKKLFNEISAQLDALEAAGKITGKQRDRVIKKAARDLGIKLGP